MKFSGLIEFLFKTKKGVVLFIISLVLGETLTAIEYFICPCILGETQCDVQYFDKETSLLSIFMISVIVAPLIETFLMQYAIMEFIIYSIKKRNITTYLLALLTSAAIFGVAHNYNPLTVVHAFLFGLIFGSVYLYQKEKGNNPFFFTFLLHALSNLIAFIIDDVMHWV